MQSAADGMEEITASAENSDQAFVSLGRDAPTSELFELGDMGEKLRSGLESLAGETDQISQSLNEFGAAGAAAGGAVQGLVRGLISVGPVGLALAAALGAVTYALYQSYEGAVKAEKEHADLERSLRSAGASATHTVKELQNYAEAISKTTLATRDDVLDAGSALAKFHSVLGDDFKRTLQLSQDMASALGGDVKANVQILGKALDEPTEAVDLLTEAGVRLSNEQKDLINDLAETGRAFEAQQVILNAVVQDVGGAGAGERAGLVGQVRSLIDAWNDLVNTIVGTDNRIAQAAGGIISGVTQIITGINAAINPSIESEIKKQLELRQFWEKKIQEFDKNNSTEGGVGSWINRNLGIDFGNPFEEYEKHIVNIDNRLAELRERQSKEAQKGRADEIAADIAAEDKRNQTIVQQRDLLNNRLAELHRENEEKLKELSQDRIAQINDWEEKEIAKLNGMRKEALERGADPKITNKAYDEEIRTIQKIGLAERARAEEKEKSSKKEIDANEKLIENMQFELFVLHMSDRERAIEQAARRLSAEATEEQIRWVRELAAQLYDEKQAMEQHQKETEVLKKLREELAAITNDLSEADRAAAQAVKSLGDNASEAAKKEAEALARKITLMKEGKKLTDQYQDSEETFAETQDHLNELLREGAIDADTYADALDDAYRKMLDDSEEAEDGLTRAWLKWRDSAYDSAKQVEQIFNTTMKGLEDVFVNFIKTGEINFDNFTDRIIEDLARIFWQRQVMGPIGDALFGTGDGRNGNSRGYNPNEPIGTIINDPYDPGGFDYGGDLVTLPGGVDYGGDLVNWGGLFAKGGAFDRGIQITAYANGDIFDNPTLFKTASGLGALGEAGPEAILPLQRLPDGRLGVTSSGASNAQMAVDAPTYVINVDARGASDPRATAQQVQQIVAQTLSQMIPGIIEQSARKAQKSVFDSIQRRGGRLQ
ncbi:putative Phage tail tape measure protein [Azospirillaceae bacterium]